MLVHRGVHAWVPGTQRIPVHATISKSQHFLYTDCSIHRTTTAVVTTLVIQVMWKALVHSHISVDLFSTSSGPTSMNVEARTPDVTSFCNICVTKTSGMEPTLGKVPAICDLWTGCPTSPLLSPEQKMTKFGDK